VPESIELRRPMQIQIEFQFRAVAGEDPYDVALRAAPFIGSMRPSSGI
jgi:hypothetical protein